MTQIGAGSFPKKNAATPCQHEANPDAYKSCLAWSLNGCKQDVVGEEVE